jgi:hypothetical protein
MGYFRFYKTFPVKVSSDYGTHGSSKTAKDTFYQVSHNILDFILIPNEFQIQYEITAGFKKKEMNGRRFHLWSIFVTIYPRPKRSNVQIMENINHF